jgi:Uncharacterized protein conserved in bacteria
MKQKTSLSKVLFSYLIFLSPILAMAQNDPIRALGEILKAKKAFKQSTKQYHRGFYDKSLASGHQSMVHIYNAEKLLVDSPVEAVKFTTDIMKAHGSNSLGIIYQQLEDLSSSRNYLGEAAILYEALSQKREQAFALSNLAMVFLQEGDYPSAQIRFKKSATIYEELLANRPNTKDSIYLFGHHQFYVGYIDALLSQNKKEKEKASTEIADALRFLFQNSNETIERQELKFKLPGIVLWAAKLDLENQIFSNKKFMLKFLNESISILKNNQDSNQSDLGKLYAYKAIYLFRNGEALSTFAPLSKKSWQLLFPDEHHFSLNEKLTKKNYGIIELRNTLFALTSRANLYFEVYLKLNDQEKLNIAYQDILLAIRLMDELTAKYGDDYNLEILLNRHAILYQTAATIITEKYQKFNENKVLSDLFYISEKQKSYIIRKAINRKSLLQNLEESQKKMLMEGDTLLMELRIIESSVASIKNSEDRDSLGSYIYKERQAREKYQTWLKNMEKIHPKLFNLLNNNQVASFSQIKEKVEKDKAAILEFMVTEDQIISILITPILDTVIIKSRTEEVDKMLQQYHECLTINYSSKDYRNTAFNLYHFLFEEVGKILTKQKIERIYLVPDGMLHSISFNALLTKAAKKNWYNNLHYLLYDYQFSRHFSATTLLQKYKSTNTLQKISFGAFLPNYTTLPDQHGDCNIFPITKNLTAIQNMAENFENARLFSEAKLSDFETNLAKFSILHLDMHSCVNFKEPNFSSLIFSFQNSEIPYELKVGSVYNKLIPVDLIVLNACDTGGGKLRNGEGIISFGRAFMYAGSKSVIMSLWATNNYASKEIMKPFYFNLSQRKMKKDEALTAALRRYAAKEAKPPIHWANFIIMGNLEQLQ